MRIAVLKAKGGVGGSTIAASLAKYLALRGMRVLLKMTNLPLLGAGSSHSVGRSGRLLNRALLVCSVAPVKGA